jgi:hypothetical protein
MYRPELEAPTLHTGRIMDKLDELLCDWYEFSQSYSPALDYGRADPACRDFRISRQWMDFDDLDAEVEANIKAGIGRVLEPMILALEMRERLAVNTAVRNFLSGSVVWVNPRYPQTQEIDYARAKAILCPKVVAAGLMDKRECTQ